MRYATHLVGVALDRVGVSRCPRSCRTWRLTRAVPSDRAAYLGGTSYVHATPVLRYHASHLAGTTHDRVILAEYRARTSYIQHTTSYNTYIHNTYIIHTYIHTLIHTLR